MKLLFPNGEHPQILIGQGSQQVGSGAGVAIELKTPGMAERHSELVRTGDSVSVRLLHAGAALAINGQAVSNSEPVVLKPGDLIDFAGVQARIVAVEKASADPTPRRPDPVDDSGATRVRMAVPKFVLRGVSGAAFGKTFPVAAPQVIGRQSDCDISIPSEEISRRHAKVRPTPVGLQVEDMGSSNGTFINGKRVQEGLLRPGEELRLDNIRFLLVAPGVEIPTVSRLAKGNEPAAKKSGSAIAWVAATVVALAAAGAVAYYLFV